MKFQSKFKRFIFCFYLLVLVLVTVQCGGNNGSSSSPAASSAGSDTTGTDTTPPQPGNSGTLTSASVASASLTLNWTAATDNASARAYLQYLAYYSTSNNIATVVNCEANGTAIGAYTADISTRGVTGLTASTTYYFNVIVTDEADKGCSPWLYYLGAV